MTQIAVVGDEEFSLGFRLAGVSRFYDSEDGVEEAFSSAFKDPGVGILVTRGDFYSALTPRMKARCDSSNRPVVVVLGDGQDESLREQIKRTVGVDLWKK